MICIIESKVGDTESASGFTDAITSKNQKSSTNEKVEGRYPCFEVYYSLVSFYVLFEVVI